MYLFFWEFLQGIFSKFVLQKILLKFLKEFILRFFLKFLLVFPLPFLQRFLKNLFFSCISSEIPAKDDSQIPQGPGSLKDDSWRWFWNSSSCYVSYSFILLFILFYFFNCSRYFFPEFLSFLRGFCWDSPRFVLRFLLVFLLGF